MTEHESVNFKLQHIQKLNDDQMRRFWRKIWKTNPPLASTDLIRRHLLWHAQKQRTNAPGSGRQEVGLEKDIQHRQTTPCVTIGTRIVRSWKGHTYTVEVVPGGYMFEQRIYRSLSAIANKITGAHWSGPRFFGVAGATKFEPT